MRREIERALVSWRRYLDAKPWLRIDSDAIFGVDDEKSGESYYASIMGRQGTLYGLALSRGEEGLRAMGSLVQQDVDHDQAITASTSICITRHDGAKPRWYRDFLRKSLGRKKGFGALPLLYVNEGKRAPRTPDPEEVRLLADALDAVVALIERDALKPQIFQSGRPMPCLHLRSDGSREVTEKTPEVRPPQVEQYRMPLERRAVIRALPRLESTDLVSCSLAPALVGGRKVRMLIVADAESELIFAGECTELDDLEAIGRRLLAVFEGENTVKRVGLPREVQTDSRYFYEAFKDALSEVGTRVICFERIPALERMRQGFADFLERGTGE